MGYIDESTHVGEDGWTRDIRPVMRPQIYKMSCCDCGLVHDVEFWIDDGAVVMRLRRNNRATGQIRRWKHGRE